MINKWQTDYRDDIIRLCKLYDVQMDDGMPSPFRHSYVYISREMIEALLNGQSISFYDGEYSHHLLLREIDIDIEE